MNGLRSFRRIFLIEYNCRCEIFGLVTSVAFVNQKCNSHFRMDQSHAALFLFKVMDKEQLVNSENFKHISKERQLIFPRALFFQFQRNEKNSKEPSEMLKI